MCEPVDAAALAPQHRYAGWDELYADWPADDPLAVLLAGFAAAGPAYRPFIARRSTMIILSHTHVSVRCEADWDLDSSAATMKY